MSLTVLFFGALLDALIGVNLFVMGEPFLLAAGYQLASGSWMGVLVVFLGGFIGDQSSFFIGRHLGQNAQRRLLSWQPKSRRSIARCRLLLQKRGNFLLTFARLLGPVAWVVPFLAGSQNVSWHRFTFFGSMGLILGVTQWVFWGYLLAKGVQMLPWWVMIERFILSHQMTLTLALMLLVMVVFVWRYWQLSKKRPKLL